MVSAPPATAHQAAEERWGVGDGWRYGAMGLPLAFVALPLYVHLPHYYAQTLGLSMTSLGVVLLAARLLDGLTDPLLGRWCDTLFARSPQAVLRAAIGASVALSLSVWALFFPLVSGATALQAWLLLGLTVAYLGYSQLTIAHQSWGARLGGAPPKRAKITAWREGLGLIGVVLASVLPSIWGWQVWSATLAVALALGLWAWASAPRPSAANRPEQPAARAALWQPWRVQAFRRLITVFVISGSASAVPATLVLFFINDRLGAPEWQGGLLALYFVAAAASMPLWMRGVRRWGLARTWLLGMVASVLVFAWAATLGHGDVVAFAVVCALSGMALGADLSLPSALLATVVEQAGDQERAAGNYFGWWNLATKWNLALAAGVTLPMLAILGYAPGATDAAALTALSTVYAVLPCILKAVAAGLVWRWLIPSPLQLH